jgi:hypothetical protein
MSGVVVCLQVETENIIEGQRIPLDRIYSLEGQLRHSMMDHARLSEALRTQETARTASDSELSSRYHQHSYNNRHMVCTGSL